MDRPDDEATEKRSRRNNVYRILDMITLVVLIVSGIVAVYFAVAEGVRDYWALVLVCAVFGWLMARRLMA